MDGASMNWPTAITTRYSATTILTIIAAWKAKVDQGDYEEVLHITGKPRKHYALTNQMEYFAETTEAHFGTNDFHPFVRESVAGRPGWCGAHGRGLVGIDPQVSEPRIQACSEHLGKADAPVQPSSIQGSKRIMKPVHPTPPPWLEVLLTTSQVPWH